MCLSTRIIHTFKDRLLVASGSFCLGGSGEAHASLQVLALLPPRFRVYCLRIYNNKKNNCNNNNSSSSNSHINDKGPLRIFPRSFSQI